MNKTRMCNPIIYSAVTFLDLDIRKYVSKPGIDIWMLKSVLVFRCFITPFHEMVILYFIRLICTSLHIVHLLFSF